VAHGRIHETDVPRRIDSHHAIAQRKQQLLILLLQVLYLLKLALQLTALAVQVKKHVDLGDQHFTIDRLGKIIHGPHLIATEKMALVAIGRDKNDGNGLRLLVAAHQLRHFEAVHAGHLYIQQYQRHFVLEQKTQGIIAVVCRQQLDIGPLEQAFERDQVFASVINNQDALHHVLPPRNNFIRWGTMSSSATTSSTTAASIAACGMVETSAVAGSWATA